MLPKITICNRVLERLSSLKSENSGYIYGVLYHQTILIIGVHLDVHGSEEDLVKVKNAFPAEVYFVGVFNVGDREKAEEEAKTKMTYIRVTDNPIYLSCKIGSQNADAYYLVSDRFESTQYKIVTDDQIMNDFIYARLQTRMPTKCELKVDAIREAFANLRKQVASGQLAFSFPKTNIYLMTHSDEESGLVGLSGHADVSELSNYASGVTEVLDIPKHKRFHKAEIELLNVTMLQGVTVDGSESTAQHAPIIEVSKKTFECLEFVLTLDTLSMIHRHTKVTKLHQILVESLMRNLRLNEIAVINEFNKSSKEDTKFPAPETFHFFPEGCAHFITRIYCKDCDEKQLEYDREQLHKQLLLPVDRPFFRRGNCYHFKESNPTSSLLTNPHVGLTNTTNDGEIFTVRGKYAYHHYMQDNMNDNGWGCAYRSLQTVVSWFKMQGYVSAPVPTHNAIQKCLVDIGDKPVSFIGSRNWIGSMEVSFVLESLYGITSRILTVSSGEEMESVGPELANHFQMQGSPIMIGGGVLAHTILGVDYNKETGSVKFLILDPHYTGAEDLKTVQSKGWCGWKGINFWDKSAYYNMCLPQVPKCI